MSEDYRKYVPDTMDRLQENKWLSAIYHITDNYKDRIDNQDIDDIRTFIFKEYAHYGDPIRVRETIYPVVSGMCIYIVNKKEASVAKDIKSIRTRIIEALEYGAEQEGLKFDRLYDSDLVKQLEDYTAFAIKDKELWVELIEDPSVTTFEGRIIQLYPMLWFMKYEAKPFALKVPTGIDFSKVDTSVFIITDPNPTKIYTRKEMENYLHTGGEIENGETDGSTNS